MENKEYKCCVCDKVVIPERVAALFEMGTPEYNITCLDHSIIRIKKGIYLGEHGTSELLLCDRVDNDSVRSIFRDAESDHGDDENETAEVDDTP